MQQNTITINVGEQLFEFSSFPDWVCKAPSRFRVAGVRGEDTLCIDAAGRVCRIGAQFMRADREKQFPIKVYRAVLADDQENPPGRSE